MLHADYHKVNIHTHLIPFMLWLINLISIFNASNIVDAPEMAFISFALLCLFSSVVWHTMAGCAHPQGMELCARIDYVGIGWWVQFNASWICWIIRIPPGLSAPQLALSYIMASRIVIQKWEMHSLFVAWWLGLQGTHSHSLNGSIRPSIKWWRFSFFVLWISYWLNSSALSHCFLSVPCIYRRRPDDSPRIPPIACADVRFRLWVPSSTIP